ncbi:MAG: hypothetical protein EA425_11875 [Puniceicoccaceae bacterium]|nr:MAG: hypothetical protein EA425_11875 [Puniceicoccaceae bacterium]
MDWDLSSYFPGFDHPECEAFAARLQGDLELLETRFAELPAPGGETADAWAQALRALEDSLSRLSHYSSYLGCLAAADSAHEGYASEEARLAGLHARLERAQVRLLEHFRGIAPADLAALSAHPGLKDLGATLEIWAARARHRMAPDEETLAADLGVDGLHAWSRLYDKLSGNLEWTFERPGQAPERLPMSRRRSLLGHPDREVRRAAFAGGNAAWEQVRTTTAAALNGLAGARLTLLRRRGLDDVLDEPLLDNRISRATLEALVTALRAERPFSRELTAPRRAALGLERIAWFDLEAPIPQAVSGRGGGPDWEEGVTLVTRAFERAYPALGAFFKEVVSQRWIDWQPRKAKRPGGFCSTSLLHGESRIFMTYQATFGDLLTLAHEAGHAFHGRILRERRPLARRYPMTLAETASTFAEMLLVDGLGGDPATDPGLRLALLDSELRHAAVFLLDIPVRFDFERRFHDLRARGEVSPTRLGTLMSEVQREWFGDILESGGEDPLFWASKLHFFISQRSFYNFPYVFGFLLSRKLFARFREEGPAFLPHYETFLAASGSTRCEALIRDTLGEDCTDPRFWTSAIHDLARPRDRLAATLKDAGPAPV